MSKLTLPLEVGKKYVRRDGQVVMVESMRGLGEVAVTNGPSGEREAYARTGRASDWPHREHPADIVADHVEPAQGHPHAALMALYAQDAAETAEPWTRWQFYREATDTWEEFGNNPVWSPDVQYRRKPKTIRIGEYDVPEPLRMAPEVGTTYWVTEVATGEHLSCGLLWTDDAGDRRALCRGTAHSTREAAEAHARALIALTEQKS